jgi:hypothetical protein
LRRDAFDQTGDDAPRFGVGLALGFELRLERSVMGSHLGYERGAIRLRLDGVLDGVLSWPAGVQQDPHATVAVPLVRNSPALDPLSDGIYGGAEMIGCLRDANTLGGRRSCRVLSVLSHMGDTRPLGAGPKALRSHPRTPGAVRRESRACYELG